MPLRLKIHILEFEMVSKLQSVIFRRCSMLSTLATIEPTIEHAGTYWQEHTGTKVALDIASKWNIPVTSLECRLCHAIHSARSSWQIHSDHSPPPGHGRFAQGLLQEVSKLHLKGNMTNMM